MEITLNDHGTSHSLVVYDIFFDTDGLWTCYQRDGLLTLVDEIYRRVSELMIFGLYAISFFFLTNEKNAAKVFTKPVY